MAKTHWRKNKDPKFLSGEDLKHGIVKGMTDGMPVEICGFNDNEGFDQSQQSKVTVTEIKFKTLDGKRLPKGVIPGKWTSDFMKKIGVDPDWIDDWVGVKVVLFAQYDKRNGFVVRFKKFTAVNSKEAPKLKLTPESKNWADIVTWLKDEKNTIDMVKKKYDLTKEHETLLCKK
jgi:hypothetical protein